MTEEPKKENEAPLVRSLHHGERTKPMSGPSGVSHVEEITAHVERHFGPVANVFHEVISDLVHLDVLVVEPTKDRPWYVLVTSGMSDLPMRVASGSAPERAELVLFAVPPEPFDETSMRDEAVYWPIRHLKQLARMPHEHDTWLAAGQTIATDPPEPVAKGVGFCAFAVLELLDEASRRLTTKDGTEIAFLQVVPMYREELEWRFAQQEPGALDRLFDESVVRCTAPRPVLVGPEFEAMVNMAAARILTGRRLVVVIAVVLVALAVADAVACHADDARIPWARVGITVWIATSMANGSSFARWITVAGLGAGIGVGARVIAAATDAAVDSWRTNVLLVSLPIWLVAAAMLAFLPAIRAFFAARNAVAAPR